MAAPEGSHEASSDGLYTLLGVILSRNQDFMYMEAPFEKFPFYHLQSPDGSIVSAKWEEMRADRGGRIEALSPHIARGKIVVEQINRLTGSDFKDPLDLLERGADPAREAFETLADLT